MDRGRKPPSKLDTESPDLKRRRSSKIYSYSGHLLRNAAITPILIEPVPRANVTASAPTDRYQLPSPPTGSA